MKLNFVERWALSTPVRVALQTWVVRRLLSMWPLPQGARTLEIGCGRGLGALLIHQYAQPGSYFAMDLDPAMLRRSSRGFFRKLPKPPHVLVGDAARIPLQPASVDAVFGFGFLHHVPAWRLAVAEVARVLRPGGAYYLEEYYPACYANVLTKRLLTHPRMDRFDSRELAIELTRAGFLLRGRKDHPKLGVVAVAQKVR